MDKLVRCIKFFLLWTFIICYVPIKAQVFTSYISADSAYNKGNYNLAIQLYKEKIKKGDEQFQMFARTYIVSLACAFTINNQLDSSFHYLKEALKHESTDEDILCNDAFISLHNDIRWKEIEAKVKNNFYYISKASNKEIAFELFKIRTLDQKYRDRAEIYGNNSFQVDSLLKLQKKVDSINLIWLEGIINKFGWPTISLVGSKGATTSFLIIQHSDLEIQKKYLPILKDAAKKNEAKLIYVAYLEDRILVSEGKPQKFGTQLRKNIDGQLELEPIEDEYDIDKKRSEMGLEPIKDYLLRYNIEYKRKSEKIKQMDDSLQAPFFLAKDLQGNTFNIMELKGKVVVINFWNLRCKPCIEEFPTLNELVADFKNDSVIFIAITEDEINPVKTFFQTKNKPFEYSIITDGDSIIKKYVSTPLKAKGFDEMSYKDIRPAHIIIDLYGNVVFYDFGALDKKVLRGQVFKALNNQH